MKTAVCVLLLPLVTTAARAQVFDTGDAALPSPNAAGAAPTTVINNAPRQERPGNFLGNDMPFLDPGGETAQWDGRFWNINNNRLFRARFEKFLATPEDKSGKDQEYRDLLLNATRALSPSRPGGPRVSAAMKELVKAAEFPIDARLCDSIAQAVYGVVLYQRNERKLTAKNKELMQELRNLGWNMEVAGESAKTKRKTESAGKDGAPATSVTEETASFSRAAQDVKRMVEIDAARLANSTKMTAGELKSKVEFQSLMIQLFLQRRFEHVIITCRLYRNMFEDADTELKLKEGSEGDKLFSQTTGVTPTVGALDALSSEFIRDVDEAVVSFEYLVEKDELESASKRLSEAFTVGEYLPRMRTLPRTKKDKVLGFVRDTNQLLSAIEIKDYTRAEELVERLGKSAKDFDSSKPRAAIETARVASGMHILNARSALIRKDEKKADEEVRNAYMVWPTNPELKEFSRQIAHYGDNQSHTLSELDSLISRKDFRGIFRENVKYAAAAQGRPEYEGKLKAIVDKVTQVERSVITADEYERAGNRYGAWEILKEISPDFPDDNEVNLRLARLSQYCASFIQLLTEAKEQEDKGRLGVSLSAYLRAEQIYPNSILAKAGIERLADKILPENNAPPAPPPPLPGEFLPSSAAASSIPASAADGAVIPVSSPAPR